MTERVASLIPFLVLLAVPAVSTVKLIGALRTGTWKRPGWFAHATWTTFLLTALIWLKGVFSGGLDSETSCTVGHHQPFDEVYRQAHRADLFRLFPLSNKCNADYDLVPIWVNPLLVVFFLLFVASVAGFLWTTAHQLRAKEKKP